MIGGPQSPPQIGEFSGGAVRTPAAPGVARATAWAAIVVAVTVAAAMLLTSPAKLTTPDSAVADDLLPDLAMRSPQLSGRLNDGRAYAVVAERAVMVPGAGRIVRMNGVRAAMELDGGRRIDMEAPSALFDGKLKHLALSGGVIARRSDGYVLRTAEIALWQAAGGIAARGDASVVVTGAEGDAHAAGVTAGPGLDPVRLTGPVTIKARSQ